MPAYPPVIRKISSSGLEKKSASRILVKVKKWVHEIKLYTSRSVLLRLYFYVFRNCLMSIVVVVESKPDLKGCLTEHIAFQKNNKWTKERGETVPCDW